MNEKFAIAPNACTTSIEWKFLLEKFGPFAGRYGMKFPADWHDRLLKEVATERWDEAERVKSLLRRADEGKALLPGRSRSRYIESREWIDNLEEDREACAQIYKVILRKKVRETHLDVESLDLKPTAGERVPSDVDSFVRVSEVLLTVGPEIYFCDPFLNVLRTDCSELLIAMFRVASRGACRRVDAWCSNRRVRGDERELLDKLQEIKDRSGLKASVQLHLVDDSSSQYKLHERWLFTQYGGVGFGQGFQKQSKNRAMNVWPMDAKHLQDCWTNLRDAQADCEFKSLPKI